MPRRDAWCCRSSIVGRITRPVFLIHDRHHPIVPVGRARALRQALKKQGNAPEYLEVTGTFTQGVLAARAPVFQQIHEFLNASRYDFDVKIGSPRVVD